jgi:hypothetical protein
MNKSFANSIKMHIWRLLITSSPGRFNPKEKAFGTEGIVLWAKRGLEDRPG